LTSSSLQIFILNKTKEYQTVIEINGSNLKPHDLQLEYWDSQLPCYEETHDQDFGASANRWTTPIAFRPVFLLDPSFFYFMLFPIKSKVLQIFKGGPTCFHQKAFWDPQIFPNVRTRHYKTQ
jgi:hypothetical protein